MPVNNGAMEYRSVIMDNNLTYVFQSNTPTGTKTDLGQTDFNPKVATTAAFFEGNSPKPPTARIQRAAGAGWDSGFLDSTKALTIKSKGWSVVPGERKTNFFTESGTGLVVSLYVLIDGIKYAWNMNRETYTTISSDLSALGVEKVKQSDMTTLVWGATCPRPAQAVKIVESGEGGTIDRYHCFVAKAKEDSLPAGWRIKKGSYSFGPNF